MALVTSKEMFCESICGRLAIGAFNVNNMETIQGIVEAGKECNSPLILQVSCGCEKVRQPHLSETSRGGAVEDTGAHRHAPRPRRVVLKCVRTPSTADSLPS